MPSSLKTSWKTWIGSKKAWRYRSRDLISLSPFTICCPKLQKVPVVLEDSDRKAHLGNSTGFQRGAAGSKCSLHDSGREIMYICGTQRLTTVLQPLRILQKNIHAPWCTWFVTQWVNVCVYPEEMPLNYPDQWVFWMQRSAWKLWCSVRRGRGFHTIPSCHLPAGEVSHCANYNKLWTGWPAMTWRRQAGFCLPLQNREGKSHTSIWDFHIRGFCSLWI